METPGHRLLRYEISSPGNPWHSCLYWPEAIEYKTTRKMPQEVELRLQMLLAERQLTQAELAKRVGVSKGTMAAYCGNSWTVLDRTVLERLADVLGCEAGSLLTTHETPFFDPFRGPDTPTCVYLRRPDSTKIEAGRPVGQRDSRAMDHVIKLLEDAVVGMVSLEDFAIAAADFEDRLRNHCVVLGSPWVNKAAEMAICRIFGIESFHPAQMQEMPFLFRAVGPEPPLKSTLIQIAPDQKPGIWLRDEKELLKSNAWPRDQFYATEIKKAQDCGVVVVCNHLGADGKVRKLIALSGFRGVGTEAAAKALTEHYRDLEPRAKDQYVWGAIEVSYDKPAQSRHREIRGYKWRYRVGGRCPVAFTFRKPLA